MDTYVCAELGANKYQFQLHPSWWQWRPKNTRSTKTKAKGFDWDTFMAKLWALPYKLEFSFCWMSRNPPKKYGDILRNWVHIKLMGSAWQQMKLWGETAAITRRWSCNTTYCDVPFQREIHQVINSCSWLGHAHWTSQMPVAMRHEFLCSI
jgi:hypothetical protein